MRDVNLGLPLHDWMRLLRLRDTSTVGFGLKLVVLTIARTSLESSARGMSWFVGTSTPTITSQQWKMADMLA
jgi:hypothetical protein